MKKSLAKAAIEASTFGLCLTAALTLMACNLGDKTPGDSGAPAQAAEDASSKGRENAPTAGEKVGANAKKEDVQHADGTGDKEDSAGASAKRAPALPPFDRGPLEVGKIKEAKAADKLGDKAFDAGDLEGAEKEYRRALDIDAGNLFARYNLARTLAKTKRTEEATETILSIRPDDCPLCIERLLTARGEKDFAEVQKDPRFIESTKDLHKSLFKLEIASKSLFDWFMKASKLETLPDNEYLDPRSTIIIEDRSAGATQRFSQLHGSAEFREKFKGMFSKPVYPGGKRECKSGCCENTGREIHVLHLKKICLELSGTSAVRLKKLVVAGDPNWTFKKNGPPPKLREK